MRWQVTFSTQFAPAALVAQKTATRSYTAATATALPLPKGVKGFEFVISERNMDKGKWCRKSVQNGYLASTVICAPRSLGAMPGGASWTWEMGTKLQYQSRGGEGMSDSWQ